MYVFSTHLVLLITIKYITITDTVSAKPSTSNTADNLAPTAAAVETHDEEPPADVISDASDQNDDEVSQRRRQTADCNRL